MDGRAASRLARRLRLRDLHALLVVLDQGSMARAAAILGLSQPAVSKAIVEMETVLGVPLLERDSRGVRPTAFGLAMAERARAVLDELGQGARDIAHMADPDVGEVRIGTTEPMANTIVAAIRHMARDRPRIAFDVAVADTGTLVADLRARRLDVVVTRYGVGAESADLDAAWLFRVPLVVVADRRHPLLRRRGLSLAATMGEPWALSPPHTALGRVVTAAFHRHGLQPPAASVVTLSITLRLGLIAGGRYLSMLPRTSLHHATNAPWLRALPLTVEESGEPIAALTLRGRFMPGPVRIFLDALRQIAPRMPGVDAVLPPGSAT